MGLLSVAISREAETPKSLYFCIDKVRYRLVTAKMNLKEFNEFLHFFRSEIKLYHNGYNILVGYGIYTISDIIWNDWNGGWAELPNVLCRVIIE